MDPKSLRVPLKDVLAVAARQQDLVTREQLLELGMSSDAIRYRCRRRRLFPIRRGIYSVASPRVTRKQEWMAAVLTCGPDAALSFESAAALYGIRDCEGPAIEVSVPRDVARRPSGIWVHRRQLRPGDVTKRDHIPVTTPACMLVDLAGRLSTNETEAAISQADSLGLIAPDHLISLLSRFNHRAGVAPLRKILQSAFFRLTDSELERHFLPLAQEAGLPVPDTRVHLDGFRVDFFWPELGLVVETDGLRYHRDPAQQAKDRIRDQTHTAAGRTPLRFTHGQVAFDREHVVRILTAVDRRLRSAA